MKYALKTKCLLKDMRQDGTSLIMIHYYPRRARKLQLNTQIAIPPEHFDEKQEQILSTLPAVYGVADDLNDQLIQMMRSVEDILNSGTRKQIPDLRAFLKETFHPSFDPARLREMEIQQDKENPKLNLDIFFQIDDYIKTQTKRTCEDMPRIYRNMKYHLEEFQTFRGVPITFETLDFTFYEELVDFLTFDYVQKRRKEKIVGLKVNTVGKTVKQFRTFLRNRIRKRIIPPVDMTGWDILEEEVDAVYLDWDEIKRIEEVDLQNYPHLEPYRHDFILGCLTGLRFSDFSQLDQYDVRGDMLYKKQVKSNHWVVIPLRPAAVQILADRIANDTPVPTNAEFNRHIKNIAKLAGITRLMKHSYRKNNKNVVDVRPKYAWITSHTCRRSFCTNEFLAGTPVELIMKISGHKSVKDFYKYIRITAEEAAIKMKEIWAKRDAAALQEAPQMKLIG